MKQDFLGLGKRGGRIVSSVDSRVTFEVERGTFATKENFVMQVLHVKVYFSTVYRRIILDLLDKSFNLP